MCVALHTYRALFVFLEVMCMYLEVVVHFTIIIVNS